ncbi:MAG TPA: C40 family peptidase [Thermomicrobiales bacterium]|nr:C40 family peptidase [Thermomicrobiales bacterium]
MKLFAAAVIVIGLFGISGLAHAIGLTGIEHDTKARVEDERTSELASVSTAWPLPTGGFSEGMEHLEGTGQWMDLILQASVESGVPWQVLVAIMGIESGGNPQTLSPVGAVGLMQVMPQYWQETANRWGSDLWDPWVNIRTSAEILTQGYLQWGSWDKAAAAYFGAIDAAGNITDAADAFGTTGHAYVDRFNNNLIALGFVEFLVSSELMTLEVQHMLEAAMTTIGTPYVWGGTTFEQGGFDCSGLVTWAYSQVGIDMPRTAAEQFHATTRIEQDQLLPGDLVFFQDTDPEHPGISHVGIYLGNGYMINAPSEDEVIQIESITTPFWLDHLAGFGRVQTAPAV